MIRVGQRDGSQPVRPKTDPSYVRWLLLPTVRHGVFEGKNGFSKDQNIVFQGLFFHIPRYSMYGMLAYIHHKVQTNVGKYTIIYMDPIYIYGIGDDAFDDIHNVTPFGIPVFHPLSSINFTFSEGLYET